MQLHQIYSMTKLTLLTIIQTILISLFFTFTTSSALAQNPVGNNADTINIGNQVKDRGFGVSFDTSTGTIVSNFILIMYIAGGLAVLVFLIWGAFDWITSGGDKDKISGARRKIMNALIGLALLSLSAFIVTLFGQIVGFNPLNTPALPRLDQAKP